MPKWLYKAFEYVHRNDRFFRCTVTNGKNSEMTKSVPRKIREECSLTKTGTIIDQKVEEDRTAILIRIKLIY